MVKKVFSIQLEMTERNRVSTFDRVMLLPCFIRYVTHEFRNIYPLIYCLAGSILALYFPHCYIPPSRGTYCESSLLGYPMVRKHSSILNPILLTRIQLTHVQLTQVSISPLSTILEASRNRENIPEIGKTFQKSWVKIPIHNVYYIDPLWT